MIREPSLRTSGDRVSVSRLTWHLTHGRWNPGWRKRLREIRRVSRKDTDAFATWQSSRIEQHLTWVRDHMPYFRDAAPTPNTALALNTLSAWPILSRANVQEHREALRDFSRGPETLNVDATGGSTGEPVRFYNDADYQCATFASELLLYEWWGVKPWSRLAVIWGDDRELASVSKIEQWIERLLGRIHLNAFDVSPEDLAAFRAKLVKHRPAVVQGYATALELVASYLVEQDEIRVRPSFIRSAAESLLPAQRDVIARAWGRPVCDVYGSRESASLAAQCRHGGFHVLAHGKVIELVDDRGSAVPPGEPGRVLITDLTNRAFGFVRYENGDVASWSKETRCACGSPYPMLEKIYGRTSDFITTPDGRRIHGEWFTHLFYDVEAVSRFQLVQTGTHRIELLTEGPAQEDTLAPILATMRERLGPDVAIAWRRVDQIPRTTSGKHRFTISHVPYLHADVSSSRQAATESP